MKTNNLEPEDAQLRVLLSESKPMPELPPRFSEGVWRRIQRAEAAEASLVPDWLSGVVNWLLNPRWAVAGITALLALGGFFGTMAGIDHAKQVAQERYLAAVAPAHIR